MSFRRNNSTLSAIATMSNRSSSLSRDESNTIAFAIDQLRQEIHELKTLIYEQQASNNELINILAPIFPRDINKEAFAKASEDGKDLNFILRLSIVYLIIFIYCLFSL